MSVIVLSNGNYRCLERTLLSLTDQSHADWEAIVVSQPSVDLTPLCKHLDPRQRIKFLGLKSVLNKGNALNAALRVAQGNVFCFLRAGNVYGPQHLEILAAEYRKHGPELLLSDVHLEVISQDQTSTTFANCLPAFPKDASLLVAPTNCLEALSFSRKQLDLRLYFQDVDHLFPEWEYLLHCAVSSASAPIHASNSDIFVQVYAGFPHELLMPNQMLPLFASVYERYPTSDPILTQARANYLNQLQLNCSDAPTMMANPQNIQKWYSEIYQTQALQAPLLTTN